MSLRLPAKNLLAIELVRTAVVAMRPVIGAAIRCALFLSVLLIPFPLEAHPGAPERIDILSHRINGAPSDQLPYIARAAIYSHNGNYELAMKDLRKAEKLGSPHTVTYQLGLLHQRRGEPAKAEKYYKERLAIFPSDVQTLEQYAKLLAQQDKPDQAIIVYKRLFAADKHPNPGLYIAAAKLLASQGEAHMEASLEIIDSGIERLGIVAQLQYYAIDLEQQLRKDKEAVRRLASLQPTLGSGPDWNIKMAQLLLNIDEPWQAQGFLNLARNQLGGLRVTPARQALTYRVVATQGEIDASSVISQR